MNGNKKRNDSCRDPPNKEKFEWLRDAEAGRGLRILDSNKSIISITVTPARGPRGHKKLGKGGTGLSRIRRRRERKQTVVRRVENNGFLSN